MNANWDHLRYFNALASQGTLSEAARQLGVSHTTVQRHVAAFEEELNVQLFVTGTSGYKLTSAGEILHAETLVVQKTLQSISSRISGNDDQMQGRVSITVSDTVGHFLLPKMLAELQGLYPQIIFHIDAVNKQTNIQDLEADIAIRAAATPPADLIGREIGKIEFALCASKQYLQTHGLRAETAVENAKHFITQDDNSVAMAFHDWLTDKSASIVPTKVNGFLSAWTMCHAGLGLALLPAYVLQHDNQIVEVQCDDIPAGFSLWVLSHADLRDTVRVKTVRQFLIDKLCPVFG